MPAKVPIFVHICPQTQEESVSRQSRQFGRDLQDSTFKPMLDNIEQTRDLLFIIPICWVALVEVSSFM